VSIKVASLIKKSFKVKKNTLIDGMRLTIKPIKPKALLGLNKSYKMHYL